MKFLILGAQSHLINLCETSIFITCTPCFCSFETLFFVYLRFEHSLKILLIIQCLLLRVWFYYIRNNSAFRPNTRLDQGLCYGFSFHLLQIIKDAFICLILVVSMCDVKTNLLFQQNTLLMLCQKSGLQVILAVFAFF